MIHEAFKKTLQLMNEDHKLLGFTGRCDYDPLNYYECALLFVLCTTAVEYAQRASSPKLWMFAR